MSGFSNIVLRTLTLSTKLTTKLTTKDQEIGWIEFDKVRDKAYDKVSYRTSPLGRWALGVGRWALGVVTSYSSCKKKNGVTS